MRKFILLLNFILFAICATIVYKTAMLPTVDPSVLRNEISFYNTVNQEAVKNFRRLSFQIAQDVKDSRGEEIISCGIVAKQNADLFENSNNQFTEAYQVKISSKLRTAALDSILTLDKLVRANCQEYLSFEQDKTFTASSWTNSTIAGINLLKLEYESISKHVLISNHLLRECTRPFCGFQTFEGFLATDLNPKWMSNQIIVNVPKIVAQNVTERIFVSLNKKAVDHLVESLKREKIIDSKFSNSYRTKIAVTSKNLLVQPLDNELQPTLTSDNTIWEFDVTATTPGRISLTVDVGLILNDIGGSSSEKNLSLRTVTMDAQQ